jgi:hypothetical protein
LNFDVFNGDADGICALIQLRLAKPEKSLLVTGVKRDIQLLDKLEVKSGDHITVLDISFEKNSAKIKQFLTKGVSIFYVDHHQSGDIPQHPNLKTLINTDRTQCTSLLVNQYLNGKYPLWAITAAFGDNMATSAKQLAASLGLSGSELDTLEKLGIYINYNSYGSCVDELFFAPDCLYQEMSGFLSPFDFLGEKPTVFELLEHGYQDDMLKAQGIKPVYQSDVVAVYLMPDSVWSRRVNGVFANDLAHREANRAHAIITHLDEYNYQVSVRAPLVRQIGADAFCSLFPTGGGRKAAAGINQLPKLQMETFISRFEAFFKA